MLNQAKTSLYVVTLIAIFFVISLVIGATSIGTVTLADQQPVEHSPDKDSVTEIREPAAAQPAMGETLFEASLNWADYAEVDVHVPERAAAQPAMGETLFEASLNWADYDEESVESGFMGKTLYEASLNWVDFTETAGPENESPRPFMGETLRQVSRNWADYVEITQPESQLPEPLVNPIDGNKAY